MDRIPFVMICQPGVPIVIGLTPVEMRVDTLPPILPDILNALRAAGAVQLFVRDVTEKHGSSFLMDVNKLLDGMRRDGESFHCATPVKIGDRNSVEGACYRIDITRTTDEVKKFTMIEDHGEIDEEHRKVLLMTIDDFFRTSKKAQQAMQSRDSRTKGTLARGLKAIKTWGRLTNVWQLCEFGLRVRGKLILRVTEQTEGALSELLEVYGLRMDMRFKGMDRRKFVKKTGDYQIS